MYPPPPLSATTHAPPSGAAWHAGPQSGADLTAFKAWLRGNGASIEKHKRPCETLRFKHGRRTGIITKDGKERRIVDAIAASYLTAFETGGPMPPPPTNRRVTRLLERDGDQCFYCGGRLGVDISVEHIIAVRHQAIEHMANLCLAHVGCNQKAADKPVIEKIKLRERLHAERQ